MSIYADYINELGVRKIIETDRGFATYRISGDECYIIDIYVAPADRKTRLASDMADQVAEVARAAKCTYLLGTVDMSSIKKTESLMVLFAYGFKLLKSDAFSLYLTKDL